MRNLLFIVCLLFIACPTMAQKASTAYQLMLTMLRTDSTWQVVQEDDRRRGDEVLRTATVLFHTNEGKRSGPAVILYEDGYVLQGEYTEGEREGPWTLRPIGKGKAYQIHYTNGAAIAVSGPKQIRRNERPRATTIPLIY